MYWRSGKIYSKELNQGSVDFKSLSPPTKEIGESKGVHVAFKKRKFIPGNLQKAKQKQKLEISWNFAIMENWVPCEIFS